ncbi:MAG TPA: phosphoribosyltransferase family protein, partial [Candidatus Methanoperedens sp.]|nr:phosphoribosyltransferase family protein [Candidatus Methanoperedens sp.]
VLMVEDVATTGGSVLKAIELLRDEGLVVEHVIVVVDREEGALSALSKAGVELIPLAKVSELIPTK